ncbi:hypothetical protein THRCLA_01792 [Thraustotheca clavata]|uniref:Uncharacterized protein n=1 Tax=Thraustotheca clavata TaxID=74557 RepID=A0A1W0A776_9STRA|nr:hypothetical protein THRCLA_01792 [Thraustotheca clavata]
MSAANTVLRTIDLCRVITEYQIGITQDSLVFRVFNDEACETLLSDAIPAILSLLEKSQAIFSTWYQAVALSRLKNVLELMPPIRYIALYDSAYNNRLDALKTVHQLYRMEYSCENLLNLTACNGSLECLKFLVEKGYEGLTSRSIDGAAEQGHLDVVKYLHEQCQIEETTAAMDLAATNGHFNVVQYLQMNCEEGSTMAAMNNAATNGYLVIVQYLHKHRHRASHEAMNRAAANGHLDIVKFLHKHRNEGYTQRALEEAKAHNHQDIVAYLTCN